MVYIIFVLFYLIIKINGEDLLEKEQDLLGNNLKLLRQDFNKIIGNVEDFAADVLRQIEEAGKLMQNGYIEENYNWQEDNTILKTTLKPTTEHFTLKNRKNPFKNREKRAILPNNNDIQTNQRFEPMIATENKQPEQICTKTNEEIVAEKQKLDQLKAEVQKLNELTSLLKDQQNLMKNIAPNSNNNVEINALESSFLYKTVKMLEEERKNKQTTDKQLNQVLNQIKINLQKTENELNKTQELILYDKDKEEILENELKRHNTDLKFLKVMMENLYDKTYTNKQPKTAKTLENNDNSIVGAINPLDDQLKSFQDQLEITLRNNARNTENFLRHLAEEQDNIRRQLIFQNSGRFQEGFVNNLRRNAPERFKKSQITRDSDQTEEINQNTNMHRLLKMLSKKDPPSADQRQISENKSKNNETDFSRSSGKSDDIDFKLKVIDILNKEGKSEEEKKEKQLQEGLLKLLKPEKKTSDTDEDALLALMTLLPKKTTNSQGSLTKLLEALKPQRKSDDFEVETELRQLQKAINNLKPKEDNFDRDESQNFQAMFSQLMAQNNAATSPQLLNQYLSTAASSSSSSVAQNQNNAYNFRPFESSSSSSTSVAPNLLYSDAIRNLYGGYNLAPGAGNYGLNGLQGANLYGPYGTGFNLAPYGSNLGNFRNGYQSGNVGYGPIYDSTPGTFQGGYAAGNGAGIGAGYGVNSAGFGVNGAGYGVGGSDFGSTFFQANPAAAGAGYTDNNYVPKNYPGPNLDQSHATSQTPDQYQYGMINDLTQQVQNLEGVITGLNQPGGGAYYAANGYDDKAAIAKLEQRIYQLKGIINGLNKPQPEQNQAQYRQNQPPQPSGTNSNAQQKPNFVPQPQPSPPQHQYRPPPPAGQTSSGTAASGTAPAYQQPKQSTVEDRNMNFLRNIFSDDRRRKRQIDLGQNKQFGFGEDPLTKLAETFKKYFEETLVQNQQRNSQQEERGSVLENLQQKLDSLKIQLGSHSLLPLDNAYGAVQSVEKKFPLQKFEDKKLDFLSEIIVSVLDKVAKLIPNILNKLFGKLLVDVGDSYGDNYSPLQNLLHNLGPVGYFPLILVKILESLGHIFKYLKKNHFFKGFLLPAGVLGLVAGAILFLIYFLQQDEPYGYLSYEGGKEFYPHYEHNNYENHYKSATNFEPNYRASMEPTNNNNNFNEKFQFEVPQQGFMGHNGAYSRGYYLDNGMDRIR